MMTAALAGVAVGDCARPVREVVECLGHGLAGLHALPASACPFDESIGVRLAWARTLVAQGLVDQNHFAERNRHASPQQLSEARGKPAGLRGPGGGPRRRNFCQSADRRRRQARFIDCGQAGRGDRYLDLELITSEIAENFGAEWVEVFTRSYGAAGWDAAKAAFFADLYELF